MNNVKQLGRTCGQVGKIGTQITGTRADRYAIHRYKDREVCRSQVQGQTGMRITGTRTDRYEDHRYKNRQV
jgi:hypothetical protein